MTNDEIEVVETPQSTIYDRIAGAILKLLRENELSYHEAGLVLSEVKKTVDRVARWELAFLPMADIPLPLDPETVPFSAKRVCHKPDKCKRVSVDTPKPISEIVYGRADTPAYAVCGYAIYVLSDTEYALGEHSRLSVKYTPSESLDAAVALHRKYTGKSPVW